MLYPWHENYPRSVPPEVDVDSFKNLIELFENSFNLYRDRPAFTCMGKTITYSELDKLSRAFGAYLQKGLGLKKGDRIALQMPNILQYPIALYGALRAGLIVVNTNPLYTSREMKHQFNDAGVKAVVILANFASNLEKIIEETGIEHIIITELGDQLGLVKGNVVNFVVKYVKKLVPEFKLTRVSSFRRALLVGRLQHLDTPNIDSSETAFLQYTGGTTGVAKGAMLTHRNMIANCLQCAAWMSPGTTGQGDLIVTPLPLYHIFSLTVNCLMLGKQGGHNLLIPNPKDINGFVKELSRYRFNIMTGVNTLFNALANDKGFNEIDFSYFRLCVGGGMAVQSSVAKKWKEVTGVPIVEGYGLTEASPVICCNRVDGFERINSIGYPLPSTHVKIVDDDGNEVKEGESGEICAKGPQVMAGYWQRKEETDKVFFGEYLRTGDIAVMEKDGSFKIVDRKKDMILVSGFNVYPNEIEEVVGAHPGVLEVAAVGVPDEKSGEAVKIFIVRKNQALSTQAIKDFCRERLTGYKLPKYVEFRDVLPKTNVGKILRRELRDEAMKNQEQG
jgi:long-chain acyl-CoA synthetase